MKKFYTKFTNPHSWRVSVPASIFKRTAPPEDGDESSDDSEAPSSTANHGSMDLEEERGAAIAPAVVEGVLFRSLPDGEPSTADEDTTEIYRVPDTSFSRRDPAAEQPYQNIVDMAEELARLKRLDHRTTSECLSDSNLDSDTTTTTDKYFECDTEVSDPQSEPSSVERDPAPPHTCSVDDADESFGDNYSDKFNEGYSSAGDRTVSPPALTPKKAPLANGTISEYAVPKITFSFLETPLQDVPENTYEVLNAKPIQQSTPTKEKHLPEVAKCKSEIKIILISPPCESKVRIEPTGDSTTSITDKIDSEVISESQSIVPPEKAKSHDNLTLLQKAAKLPNRISRFDLKLAKSLTDLFQKNKSNANFEQMVPEGESDVSLRSGVTPTIPEKRTSVSLTNIASAAMTAKPSLLRSLDNIQVVRFEEAPVAETPRVGDAYAYCEARDNLPGKIRRATLVKRTFIRSRAVDSWSTFRSRLNNIISTQAAAQRVGAQKETSASIYEEYPKAAKSVDKMYRKTKKQLTRINGRLFDKKRPNEQRIPEEVDDIVFVELDRRDPCRMADSDSERFRPESVTCESIDGSSVTGGDQRSIGAGSGYKLGGKRDLAASDSDRSTIKSAFRRSKYIHTEGQNGFDDLRRYVKQGGDFCKELSTILQERSDAEIQYAKSLSKLSSKLSRACRENVGGINDAWKSVATDMETRADVHRQFSLSLCEEIVKPLRQLTDVQHKIRKHTEGGVDKTVRGLADWRTAEAKSKKQSHTSARDNEKLQDALLDVRLSRSTSLIHLSHLHGHKTVSDKDTAKLEQKKRKAEDAVKKSDIEYYTLCVRAERARLEWESAVLRGAGTFQGLEEDRLNNLKTYLNSFLQLSTQMDPRLHESTESLRIPISKCDALKDIHTFSSLRHSSQHVAEQLLPDFYCEHITLAMNRERRKQALVKLLQLIRQDLDRERKSKHGLENLSRAIKQTPNFGTDDSQQNVSEKLYHIRSMLTYLEGARYKVQNALAEIDNRQRISHPLAAHISITRDKSGLQQSILKVPPWLREEATKVLSGQQRETVLPCEGGDTDIVSDWIDRGMGDGNSNQPDSDFDEFSSQSSESTKQDGSTHEGSRDVSPVEDCATVTTTPICHCRALYEYRARLSDELSLYPGDVLSVYRQQPDGWWLGECSGAVGIFPATYVEQIEL